MSKFAIKIDTLWAAPLLLIGATHAKSWAEVGDQEIDVKFGVGEEKIPLAEVLAVEPHEWSIFYGIGHRLGYGGIGYVGSTEGVVEIKLKKPHPFKLIFGLTGDYASFFVSLEDPEGIAAEVRRHLS